MILTTVQSPPTACGQTAANWTGDAVPTSIDNVFVTGNKTITLNYVAPTVNEVSLVRTGNGTVTVNQTNGGTLTVNSWFNLGQGYGGGGGTGTWNMSGDSVLNSNHSTGGQTVIACGFATSPAYDTGILTLSDTAQFLQTAADFRIGGEFNGTRANGTVTLNNSSKLNLSGTGEFIVGNSGNGSSGTLNLNQDAQVTTAGNVRVANFAGGTGTVVQSGSSIFNTSGGTFIIGDGGTATYTLNGSSQLNRTGDLHVGAVASSGTLTLNDSAKFTTNSVVLVGTGGGTGSVVQNATSTVTSSGSWFSIGAGGTGSYTMNGGTLNVTSWAGLNVGDNGGSGTMTVTSGTVNAPNLFVGKYGSTNGVFTQSSGTVNATGFIRVGDAGTGELTLSGDGAMNTNVGLQVGTWDTGTGTVNLDGGTITTPSVSAGTGTSSFHFNGGTLKASVSTATFMQGLDTADIEAGGAIIHTNGKDITIAQDLVTGSPSGGLTKQGTGSLTLNGSNSYTGNTLVSAGTLLVNGSLGNSPTVTVDANGTIGGSGLIAGSLNLDAAAKFTVVNLADALSVSGTVTFGSGFGIANLLGINWDALDLNTPYTVLSTTQTFGTGSIANFGFDNRVAVGTGREAYFTNGSLAVVVVPEPRAALLGGLGLLALLRRRR